MTRSCGEGVPSLVKRTDKSISEEEHLLRDIRNALLRGYSVDDEEEAEGVLCFGAEVLDRPGHSQPTIGVRSIKPGISPSVTSDVDPFFRSESSDLLMLAVIHERGGMVASTGAPYAQAVPASFSP